MIKLKNMTIKNFMSVGAATQAINFQDIGLALVLGNNLDLGGNGSRNGTGKTTIINALSYALYGNALSNIKKSNLINKTNGKGMIVTVEFEINGTNYRIERGRSPNILRFLVNNQDAIEETDEGQGEMRLTQKEIERVLGMNHMMFKYLVALNTYNEPFLSLRANDQREIIENLMGITLLSEKANILKEMIKETKDKIKEEEYRIKGIENANEQIKKTIDDLKRRQRIWKDKIEDEILEIEKKISDLEALDLEHELEQHVALEEYLKASEESKIIKKEIAKLSASIAQLNSDLEKANNDLEAAKNHRCYACGQELHDDSNQQIIETKTETINTLIKRLEKDQSEKELLEKALNDIILPKEIPVTKYSSAHEAYEQQNQLTTLQAQLESLKNSEDPYQDQIKSLEDTGLQPVKWDYMNELHVLREHQEFLYKLLINKDSFVRKSIIEQNLQYLNSRLSYYLARLGLPHEVTFKNDLSVEITELGRDLDFDNLSRGERNRLILGLSWAFRDVHESIKMPIDFMAVDELIDSGMDTNGVESALGILKEMNRDRNKNILLISHRDELIGRVNNIISVVKENGFTSFSNDQEFDI